MYDVIPDSDEQRLNAAHAASAPGPDSTAGTASALAAAVTTTEMQRKLAAARQIPPAAVLAYRTPLEQPPLSADGKATTVLTLLGLMFTVLGRFAAVINLMVRKQGWEAVATFVLLSAFALLAFAAVVQAFRTISPRFPEAAPSLAFFGDIARLSREEYLRQVEGLTSEQALDQMLLYNHTAAVIIVEKLRQLRYCFVWFQAALGAWLMMLAMIAWNLLM